MQYVRSPKPQGLGCALCEYRAARPERQSLVLSARRECFVVLNRYPYTSAHLMVVPWRHSSMLEDLTSEEESDLWHVVQQASVRLRRATQAEGLNIGLNLGAAAGAGIDQHLHVHLVPRWQGDHNFMPVLGEARVILEYLEETWDYLRPHFADLDVPRRAEQP